MATTLQDTLVSHFQLNVHILNVEVDTSVEKRIYYLKENSFMASKLSRNNCSSTRLDKGRRASLAQRKYVTKKWLVARTVGDCCHLPQWPPLYCQEEGRWSELIQLPPLSQFSQPSYTLSKRELSALPGDSGNTPKQQLLRIWRKSRQLYSFNEMIVIN